MALIEEFMFCIYRESGFITVVASISEDTQLALSGGDRFGRVESAVCVGAAELVVEELDVALLQSIDLGHPLG